MSLRQKLPRNRNQDFSSYADLNCMKRLILHIGYPKTATTAFQKHIFSQLPKSDWEVVSPEERKSVIASSDLKKILQGDEGPFNPKIAQSKKDWLVSIEGILFDSIRELKNGTEFQPKCWERTLLALQSFSLENGFNDISVVVWLRRQDELLHSVYAESYSYFFRRQKEFNSLEKYVSKVIGAANKKDPIAYAYHFQNILSTLFDTFGRESVNVFFYENLELDPDAELRKLSAIVGFNFRNELKKTNVRRVESDVKLSTKHTANEYLISFKKKILWPHRFVGPHKANNKLAGIQFGIRWSRSNPAQR